MQGCEKPRKTAGFTFESSALNRTQPPFLFDAWYYAPAHASGKEKWTGLIRSVPEPERRLKKIDAAALPLEHGGDRITTRRIPSRP